MKLITVFTVAIAAMFGVAEGAILPIRIPLDRVYDSLWAAPAHPILDLYAGLRPPPSDTGERDGYYTFETTADGDITSLVRVTNEASILTIVEDVDFLAISDHALFFLGSNVNGILIQNWSVEAGFETEYSTESIAESQIKPKEWLVNNFGTTVLPISIPFDRAYDTQWNPPGHPTLSVSWLTTLSNPAQVKDGHYTFELDWNGNMKSFLWVTDEGAMVTIFEDIDPLLISEDVFFFNGNPTGDVLGGGFGTLIQGFGVTPGQDGDYAVQTVEESNIAPKQWLSDNFKPQDGATILPLDISLERVYDVQWTYPAYPKLSVFGLQEPALEWGERDGHYTFGTNGDGDISKFVRIADDGTVLTIFEEVEFVAINKEVLFFLGDFGFGTIIQAGNSFGKDADYATESVEDSAISPEGFLHLHFGIPSDSNLEAVEDDVEEAVSSADDAAADPMDVASTAYDLGSSTCLTALITGTVAAAIVAIA